MTYELPTSVLIKGKEFSIRSDYRTIIDILVMLEDPDLEEHEKVGLLLTAFYPEYEEIPEDWLDDAVKKFLWFVDCGRGQDNNARTKLVDWEKDFQFIIFPINRMLGKDIRENRYLHWWTFISYYYEIGECLFAQIVRIRSKKMAGKPLDKSEKEFYRKNRDLIDFETKYSVEENERISEWI